MAAARKKDPESPTGSANISTQHPQYSQQADAWETLRDCYGGERAVKAAGTRYLPLTPGQMKFGAPGTNSKGMKAYEAYKVRAVFPGLVRKAVESNLGIMHRKPAIIEAPPALDGFIDHCTQEGEDIQALLRKINEQQILPGRVGFLLDLPADTSTKPTPYIAVYEAETIINWDTDIGPDGKRRLTLVVLAEMRHVRTDRFSWEIKPFYRVLEINSDGNYQQTLYDNQTQVNTLVPLVRGEPLKEIPFCIANTKDNAPDVDTSPIEGLAALSLAIYRGEADLRQSLFMSGQDTLVIEGGEPNKEYGTGAGTILTPSTGNKVYYVGVSTGGLQEQRHNIEGDKQIALTESAQLFDTTSRQKESGDALRIRAAASTATLQQIALTGGACVTRLLRMAAIWMGVSEDESRKILCKPNLDFTAESVSGKDLTDMMTAKMLGAPFSMQEIHEYGRRGGVTDKTFEESSDMIEMEPPLPGPSRLPPSQDAGQPSGGPPKKARQSPSIKNGSGLKPNRPEMQ